MFGDIVNGKLFYRNINTQLSYTTIHEIKNVLNSKETDLIQMSKLRRLDVRTKYDPFSKKMYNMTKSGGKIRRITNAFFEKNP